MAKNKVVVVGGGLAGLMATLKIAEAGIAVDLFSLVPVKRSHSACAQGGVNAAINTKGENDSTWRHLDDTVYGGDFLANQPQVKRMCDAAPALIHMFDRMGVMFSRTPEGLLDFRRFGGTLVRRTAYAGATTGQQLLYALDEQVRRLEVEGKVTKYEGWEFVSAIMEDGVCRGITAQNLATMEIVAFPADAVLCATGGLGAVFGKSTNSTINTGYAAARLYRQGATYANGEFIQIHPTAIPGVDKNRLMSESARGEGGRVWTYKDGKPWYFLEEKYPLYKNLVPATWLRARSSTCA
jgi:sdhA_Bsu: succinate dehydrogenase or fumarate reductase, flavoprotein subunit